MRILVALDGSVHAEVARDLVASLSLPPGSTVRVIAVLDRMEMLLGGPWMPVIPANAAEIEARALAELDQVVACAGELLEHPGIAVETAVVRGHPATTITSEAAAFRADLVVVGSRGHGPFQTVMLGSVSAEVVDHAPCPVFIARHPSVGRILLAHDGSSFAESAASVLRDLPIFGEADIDVVSVMPERVTWAPALPNTAATVAGYERRAREDLRRHEEIASSAVRDLQRAGRVAHPVVLEGHPAVAIVAYAARASVDLIVVGTHGRTGLSRLMLGSIARSLVTHSTASILVVRPRPAQRRVEVRVPGQPRMATAFSAS